MADLHPDFYKSLGGGFSDIFFGMFTPIYLGELGEDSHPFWLSHIFQLGDSTTKELLPD